MGGRVAKLQNRRPVKTPKRQNHDFLDFAVKTPKRQNHDFLSFAESQNLTILKRKSFWKPLIFSSGSGIPDSLDFAGSGGIGAKHQLRLWNP